MPKKTPLYDEHVKLGAKIIDFGGWMMPIQYSGIIEEHKTVRTKAGLFDVSHMGEIEFAGENALDTINYLTTNNASLLSDGQAQYSVLVNDKGTIVDDIIVYRFNQKHFIMVVNASNIEKDFAWISVNNQTTTEITNRSDDFALMALQGPLSDEILQPLTKIDLYQIKTFHFTSGEVCDIPNCIVARTGYTGENGFEIFAPPASAVKIWETIIEQGKSKGLAPVGLGARDTLRLEMKYSLYGNDITDETNPLEAGLGWVVKLEKPNDFIGKKALLKIKEEGLKRKLVGFKMIDKGIPRHGFSIANTEKEKVGIVTSGTMSPSLNEPIGLGYVPISLSKTETKILIDIRGQLREAIVSATPFYKKTD